ncbi:immunoglobulin-like domain-containing protein, partial [Paenibacillus sp. CCS19]|uniref:immunoglobulin-like domain-containing protein n=1 Tax=Paenibacillus sp. CCS19 TaxID=3158387 RepID=UPI00295F35EA
VGYASGDSASDVKQNLTLSTAGLDGTSITWSSDKSSIVAANGTVTRPSYTAGDALVTLTATIKKGSVEETKTFTLTVTKLAQTDAEAVAAAKAVVEVG